MIDIEKLNSVCYWTRRLAIHIFPDGQIFVAGKFYTYNYYPSRETAPLREGRD